MKVIFQKLTFMLAACLFLFHQTSEAQAGCTDPQALNYDEAATENDGSCEYQTTTYFPNEITDLNSNLSEASGLAFFENRLFTHLDGGNPDQLYEIDTLNGSIKKTITIPLTDNLDWEDLAEDNEYLYIGDFGNNFGNRTNLRIYKILKTDFIAGTISPELIEFSYSDQTNFTPAQNSNNYDCEAFFFWNDSLHLFSKNWVDFKTRHYVLPAIPGEQIAELRDSLNVQGQITAADITENGEALLLGYNTSTSEVFLWLLFDFHGSNVFSGNKRRISMGSAIATSQVEGIVFRDSTRGYICSEKFSILPPKLLEFDIYQWLDNPVPVFEKINELDINVFPNPATDHIQLTFNNSSDPFPYLKITDLSGKIILERFLKNPYSVTETSIDISFFPPGSYWIIINSANMKSAKLIHKQ